MGDDPYKGQRFLVQMRPISAGGGDQFLIYSGAAKVPLACLVQPDLLNNYSPSETRLSIRYSRVLRCIYSATIRQVLGIDNSWNEFVPGPTPRDV